MPAEIRLIATDLDGTLIGSANELPFYTDFNDQLERLRGLHGTIWAACTGRKFSSFWEFFHPMRRMGLLPDYVIVRHAYIYRRTAVGFLPHIVWNISILLRLWREGRAAHEAIDHWHETLTAGAIGVSTIRRSSRRLGLRFDSPESASVAANLLRQEIKEYRHLHVTNYGSDVDVRTIPSTKGLALSELAHYLDIERENILTIGNGSNDISMLDGAVAGMVGCPSNSDADVIEVVHKAGGHVASHRALRGVMDVLDAYTEGTVCSDLPRDWTPAVEPSNPARSRISKGASRRKNPRSHPLLFATIAYTALLTFACFDTLPYSSWIRKPLDLLITVVVHAFSWI
ncbi:MAG: HAD hydrolase family protein [Lentisphaerae bacterium]|nr:HAD hydrolase family protein [Lentisphaerota bacterium]